MYKLYFDTSDKRGITVKLYKNKLLISEKSEIRQYTSQTLLPLINNICNENNISPKHIN